MTQVTIILLTLYHLKNITEVHPTFPRYLICQNSGILYDTLSHITLLGIGEFIGQVSCIISRGILISNIFSNLQLHFS